MTLKPGTIGIISVLQINVYCALFLKLARQKLFTTVVFHGWLYDVFVQLNPIVKFEFTLPRPAALPGALGK